MGRRPRAQVLTHIGHGGASARASAARFRRGSVAAAVVGAVLGALGGCAAGSAILVVWRGGKGVVATILVVRRGGEAVVATILVVRRGGEAVVAAVGRIMGRIGAVITIAIVRGWRYGRRWAGHRAGTGAGDRAGTGAGNRAGTGAGNGADRGTGNRAGGRGIGATDGKEASSDDDACRGADACSDDTRLDTWVLLCFGSWVLDCVSSWMLGCVGSRVLERVLGVLVLQRVGGFLMGLGSTGAGLCMSLCLLAGCRV